METETANQFLVELLKAQFAKGYFPSKWPPQSIPQSIEGRKIDRQKRRDKLFIKMRNNKKYIIVYLSESIQKQYTQRNFRGGGE